MLGVPVDDVTMDEAVEVIVGFVQTGRRTGRWHQVTTVNLDFVANAVKDRALLRLLQRASLNIPDGAPVIWAAKALGTPLRARVAGVDVVESLAARAAASDLTMYMLGGAPGVAEEAVRVLGERHPGAALMYGSGGPPFTDVADMDATVLDEIRVARPDVLCVALGNPKQERWIERYGPELDVPVLIGIGGTLDFIVGRRRRAPLWMQRAGLEWLARMLQEPARLGPRYARDAIVCVPRFAAQWWRQRARRPAGARRAAVIRLSDAETVQIDAVTGLDIARDAGLRNLGIEAMGDVRLDLSAVERADARTVAAVVSLARNAGGIFRVDNVGRRLRQDLARAGVLELIMEDADDPASA